MTPAPDHVRFSRRHTRILLANHNGNPSVVVDRSVSPELGTILLSFLRLQRSFASYLWNQSATFDPDYYLHIVGVVYWLCYLFHFTTLYISHRPA